MTLAGKESVELPVLYFVDPRIGEEDGYDEVRTITLSYTFFESSEEAPGMDGDPSAVVRAGVLTADGRAVWTTGPRPFAPLSVG